ncbi:hypothetical protein ACFC1T_25955 [Kitasatospora sp. NPDC056076]|uniref:hypothetical protein n=1 Tax=Kitasatospora sp. NPDC056076 TaxID=3345703 RepID=UPI0035DC4318
MPNTGSRLIVELAGWWALLFMIYLVFISTLSPLELMVGAGACAMATTGAWAIHRAAHPAAGPAGHLPAALWAWPATALTETAQLSWVTVAALRGRPARGRFARVRLRPGVGAPWACVLLSATPGSCVVAVDEEKGRPAVLTAHSLFDSRSRLESVLAQVDPA